MSAEKKRILKQKKRKQKVQNKLTLKREVSRAITKEKRDEFRAQRQFAKDQRVLQKAEKAMEEIYEKLPQETKEQLQRNMEILKALEAEHAKELADRKERVLAAQESQPLKKREIAAVEVVKAPASDEKAVGAIGGSAECSFKANS